MKRSLSHNIPPDEERITTQKIAKIHSILKNNFSKDHNIDYGVISVFLEYALPSIRSHELYKDEDEMVEKAGKESKNFVWLSEMPIELLTRYKILHDIANKKEYEESVNKMCEDYVIKFYPKL